MKNTLRWRIWGQEFEDGRDWRIGERSRAPPWRRAPYATSFDIYQHDVYEADERIHHSIRISKPTLK